MEDSTCSGLLLFPASSGLPPAFLNIPARGKGESSRLVMGGRAEGLLTRPKAGRWEGAHLDPFCSLIVADLALFG